jgi:hypothetical protein
MLTTKCVGAVTLTATRGALHGAQIPETPSNWANQATSDHGSPSDVGLAESNLHSILWDMATADRLLYSALHGTAMRYAAERRNLGDSIEEIREIAGGRDDILAEAAGIEAGWWYASPATHAGYELVAAGMLIMAGGHEGKPLDFDALERWTRVGYERGMRSRHGER